MTSGPSLSVPMTAPEPVLDHRPRLLVDLRSPTEFAEDHLPGAHNLPLFDDVERALIGTLYRRHSPAAAFEAGRQRTLAKITPFTHALAELAGWSLPAVDLEQRVARMTSSGMERLEHELEREPARLTADSVVLYCWRGGLRSRAVIGFLRGLGREDVLGIEGGYRAYRRCIRARVEGWRAPPSFVLRGLTGVGKTLVLRALAEQRPAWVLDLEAMAGHRSSILGMVGLEPASQKLFESRLAERVARGFGDVCVVEGESRKVGDLILPDPFWRAIDGGVGLELTADRARRVRVLCDDYLAGERSRAELARQLPFIETRLGPRWSGQLITLLETGRERELVELLLERYYDPLYRHSERGRSYEARFDATDPPAAAAKIASWIEERCTGVRATRGLRALPRTRKRAAGTRADL